MAHILAVILLIAGILVPNIAVPFYWTMFRNTSHAASLWRSVPDGDLALSTHGESNHVPTHKTSSVVSTKRLKCDM